MQGKPQLLPINRRLPKATSLPSSNRIPNCYRYNARISCGSGLFYTLLLAPFFIIPIIILAKKKKEAIDRDVTGNRIRQSNKLAKKFLSEANKQMGNKAPFYDAMERALHNFLKAKLSIETSEMSKENIQELLVSKKAQSETITEFHGSDEQLRIRPLCAVNQCGHCNRITTKPYMSFQELSKQI